MATVTARAAGWAALAYAVAEAGGLLLLAGLLAAGPAAGEVPMVTRVVLQALKVVLAGTLLVVAAWVSAGRTTTSDRLGVAGAWVAALALATSAVAGTVVSLGDQSAAAATASGVVQRATVLRLLGTGVWLLGVTTGHAYRGLTTAQQSAAGLVALTLLVGSALGPFRLAGLAGAVVWFTWVGVDALQRRPG